MHAENAACVPCEGGVCPATTTSQEEKQTYANLVAGSITTVSDFASSTIGQVGSRIAVTVERSTAEVAKRIPKGTKELVVPAVAERGLERATSVTQTVVSAARSRSSAAVDGVCGVVGGTAKFASRFVPAIASPYVSGVAAIGSAALAGSRGVVTAAHDAAADVVSASCSGVSRVVTQRYGAPLGEFVAKGMNVVTSAVTIGTLGSAEELKEECSEKEPSPEPRPADNYVTPLAFDALAEGGDAKNKDELPRRTSLVSPRERNDSSSPRELETDDSGAVYLSPRRSVSSIPEPVEHEELPE